MPDDVLRMPWHTGYRGGGGGGRGGSMQKRLNILRLNNIDIFYMIVHVLLHLINEMRKVDNM